MLNQPNGIAIFGFISGFFTVVMVAYRQKLKTRLPIIVLGMACCSAYAFMAGVWSVAFVLLAVSGSEFQSWWGRRNPINNPVISIEASHQPARFESDSRITRMFGRT